MSQYDEPDMPTNQYDDPDAPTQKCPESQGDETNAPTQEVWKGSDIPDWPITEASCIFLQEAHALNEEILLACAEIKQLNESVKECENKITTLGGRHCRRMEEAYACRCSACCYKTLETPQEEDSSDDGLETRSPRGCATGYNRQTAEPVISDYALDLLYPPYGRYGIRSPKNHGPGVTIGGGW